LSILMPTAMILAPVSLVQLGRTLAVRTIRGQMLQRVGAFDGLFSRAIDGRHGIAGGCSRKGI
jgi:hypothetical protein